MDDVGGLLSRMMYSGGLLLGRTGDAITTDRYTMLGNAANASRRRTSEGIADR